MQASLLLPPGVAVAILAFLLALLPAGLFLWLGYLRRTDRPVPAALIGWGFVIGLITVLPTYWLETAAASTWRSLSPATVHNFLTATFPLESWQDVVLPALGTFLIVATIEEGLRYLIMRWWFRRSRTIDQVFDGLAIGLSMGLGFATLENAWYFLDLFSQENFDTLVFVFFLRFLVSTLLHASLGGIMGALLTKGLFSLYWSRRSYLQAFFVPWLIHGAFDLLLTIGYSAYAVLLLLPPLLVLIHWLGKREFLVINRKEGKLLLVEEAPTTKRIHLLEEVLRKFSSPWNIYTPWIVEKQKSALLHHLEQKNHG